MKKLIPVLLALLFPQLSSVASAQCSRRESMPEAFSGSSYVFSGRVVWLDPIVARIQVDKIWKGDERSEIVMRTGTLVTAGGFMSVSERFTYTAGQQYVIYASGSLDQLVAPPCSRSGLLTDPEVAALDAITSHKKIGTEMHRCASVTASTGGEIRVSVSTSSEVSMPAVRVTLDGSTRRDGARTDDSGHVVFAGLPPGEYKVTADIEGHTPKQATVNLPEKTCIDTAMFLSAQ